MAFRHSLRFAAWTLTVLLGLPLTARANTTAVAWRTNLDAAKIEAIQSRRLLLVHFTTRTCGPCKLLDKNVFSQPYVATAIEQDFVPVRIDADESPALARSFRIDRVPTELILTAEGNVLANPPIPDKPEPYLAQLQNLARHFKQSAPAAPAAAPAVTVNPAYAGLPAPPAPAQQQGSVQAAPQVVANPAVQPQQSASTVAADASTPADRYGEVHNVYATPPHRQAALQKPSAQSRHAEAAGQPALPGNAMPRSYASAPPAEGADAAGAAIAAAPVVGGAAITDSGAATPPGIGVGNPAAAVAAAAAGMSAAPDATPAAAPSGTPRLAFDGFCPVTLKTYKKWAPGDARYGAIHRGCTYLFVGAEQRDQFMADPDKYSPVFAGLDPVLLIDSQQSVPGKRDFGFEYGGLFYLFSSKGTMQKFGASHQQYAAGVRQAMSRLDAVNGAEMRR
jgi:protein disulfide-isomerase